MIGTEQWRAAIGSFNPRHTAKTHLASIVVKAQSCRMAIRFVLLCSLLLCCGDIETNPGPNKNNNNNTHQTRSKQTTIAQDGTLQHSPQSRTPSESAIYDVLSAVNTLTTQFQEMNIRLTGMDTTLNGIKTQTDTMQRQMNELIKDNQRLDENNKKLNDEISILHDKIDDLESRSRRNNLIVHGLPPEKENETWDDVEKLMKKTLGEKLGIDMEEMRVERAHRIRSTKSPGPIIAKFVDFKQKDRLLKERSKLKDTGIFLSDDFTPKVREKRRKLGIFMNRFRSEGKKATLVYDHLIVNGERYNLDPTTDSVYPVHRQQRPDTPLSNLSHNPVPVSERLLAIADQSATNWPPLSQAEAVHSGNPRPLVSSPK